MKNRLAAGALHRTPLGELTVLPQTPVAGGEGWLPLHKNPTPALSPVGLGLRAEVSFASVEKNPGYGPVCSQLQKHCIRGFQFLNYSIAMCVTPNTITY